MGVSCSLWGVACQYIHPHQCVDRRYKFLHNHCDLTSDKTNLMLQNAIKPLSLNRDRFRERFTSSVGLITANFALQTDLLFNAVQGGFGVSDVDVGCSHG